MRTNTGDKVNFSGDDLTPRMASWTMQEEEDWRDSLLDRATPDGADFPEPPDEADGPPTVPMLNGRQCGWAPASPGAERDGDEYPR